MSNPSAWARAIGCKSVYITRYRSMKVPISFQTLHAMADNTILVDSGATDNFIHPKLLRRLGLGSQPLERPRKIWNIDGTTNKAGALTHCVDLEVRTGDRQETMKFLITDLGGEDLILGYPWLSTFEPKFRWRDTSINMSFLPIIIRTIDWRKLRIKPVIARIVKGRRIQTRQRLQQEAIFQELERESSLKGISIESSREAGKFKQEVEVPEQYHRHTNIFDPIESKKLPPSRPWDHAITLKPDAPETIDCKLYPLPPKDYEALKLCASGLKRKKTNATSDHLNHPLHRLSSFSEKLTDRKNRYKTIEVSTNGQFATDIHSLLYQN